MPFLMFSETHEDSDASFHDDTEITAPGKPELVRLHHTVVEIKWTPSNSTTVHYKVEQSTPLSKNWRKADTKPYISSCKATINSLLPEKAYFFRVQTYRKRDLLAVGESSDLIRTGDAHRKSKYYVVLNHCCSLFNCQEQFFSTSGTANQLEIRQRRSNVGLPVRRWWLSRGRVSSVLQKT